MALDEGTAPLPGAAGEREVAEAQAPRWPARLHRAALVLTAGSVVLALVFAYRLLVERPPVNQLANATPLLLSTLAVVIFGSFALCRPERGTVRGLIWTAAIWSLALLVALGTVWFLVQNTVRGDHWVGTPIESQAELEAYLADTLPAAGAGQAPWLVPTGVMIQSIEFLNANNVQVTGFVWQKYDAAIPDDVARGFVLPEALREAYSSTEAYRYVENGTEIIGWYFYTTLRQEFDYGDFPFDRQDVWIRLWHRDFERHVLLVPDFASYTDLAPQSLPGIEQRFVYGGWEPENSGFSYALNRYDATFGLGQETELGSFPELYFNFSLKRAFIGPFFDHIVFSAAVALLLFLTLVLTTSDEDLKGRFGLSTAGVVGATSGLLFAVILKQSQIRSSVGSLQITYLETLPFLLAVLIVLVALNAILLSSPHDIKLIEYRHNLLPALLYWPLLLGLLLAVSLIVLPVAW